MHSDVEAPSAPSISWLDGAAVARPCPNCGSAGPKRAVLRAALPGVPDGVTTLLACDACGCRFFDPLAPADYAAESPSGGASLAFYLQQGANLGGAATNLAGLGLPAGARYLEVGCGFGFGLDFAIRGLGWRGRGLDPSPFAAAGRAALGLPIEGRYLRPEDAGADQDVVMASEVIEHVPDPAAFARTLRAALAPDGVLLLTTPAAEAVEPRTPPGLLVPLLSPGFHLVLQSARSLEALLRGAGFATVEVQRAGASLLARAAAGAPRWAGRAGADRSRYRRYLAEAARGAPRGSDLWLGFAARAYREAVVARDLDEAGGLHDELAAACTARYGFAPEAVASRTPPPPGTTLEALAATEPLCLGVLLLHRAWHRLHLGAEARAVLPLFDAAAAASGRLRAALAGLGSDDGDAEDVGWRARAEAAIAAAGLGDPSLGERLAALPPAPGEDAGLRRAAVLRRCFVGLVNGGHLAAAGLAEVAEAPMARAIAGAPLPDDELDALYCRATLELQREGGDPAAALPFLRAGRAAAEAGMAAGATGSARGLFWPLLDAEILALRMLGATAALQELERAVPRLAALPGAPSPPPHLAGKGRQPR
jgi:SAM-dependent methyltransferase